MKQEIQTLLEDSLPLVDFSSDFLFAELDSLSIAQILMTLSLKYGIKVTSKDVTPKNFKNIDSIVNLVTTKIEDPSSPPIAQRDSNGCSKK